MQLRNRTSSVKRKGKNLWLEVGGILVFALGVFLLCALITYHPGDPSWFANGRGVALNACGRVGAFFAALFLHAIGLGSFLLPAALIFVAATVHNREGWARIAGVMAGMSVAVMSIAVFLTIQKQTVPYAGTALLTGGAFGAWVADRLVAPFNSIGASIISLVVFLLALSLSTPILVSRALGRGTQWLAIWVWKLARFGVTAALLWGGIAIAQLSKAISKFAGSRFQSWQQKREAARLAASQAPAETSASSEGKMVIGLDDGQTEDEEEHTAEEADAPEGDSESESPSEAAYEPLEMEAPVAAAVSEAVPEILPMVADSASTPEPARAAPPPKPARSLRPVKRGDWKLPTVEFLRKAPKIESSVDRERLIENSQILKQKFADFGIDGEVTAVRPGPVITLYEFKPGPGVKVSKIASLADDLSMALSAESVRILAPLPGKSVVGIEIPSDHREKVFLREFLQDNRFFDSKYQIPVVMGKDIGGQPVISDLARMPHLLCAGQTGSGKSVFMNGLICSLFYRFTPDELRMILVDPKFIEFRSYQDLPHLLLPVVDDAKQAATALKWTVREMERRYRILAALGVRNLQTYNQKCDEMGVDVVRDILMSEENQDPRLQQMSGGDWIESFEQNENGEPMIGKMPFIVVIIDELADLMMVARKEVEISIARISQKARAAGIHLVCATQRPSTDVITGLIKANLPSRLSFQLASFTDSKTILDRSGAERLLGQGDMLFIPPASSQPLRLHGAYVDDEEINKITSFLKSQGKPMYRDEILLEEDEDEMGSENEEDDALFSEAVDLVKRQGHASASFLQRHLKVGYNRAARMIETMETRGIVGPADGAKPREVLLR